MKTNEQIAELLKQKQFDDARSACIERLKHNGIDSQSWASLGESFAQQGHGTMAVKCFRRARLLDPFAGWIDDAIRFSESIQDDTVDFNVVDLLAVPRKTVAALILTRDSSRTIAACLTPLKEAVDEIIVVDTGSVDDTVNIAQQMGIEVHHFPWCDDFSAARNFSLGLATTDWVIAVDSDEILYIDDIASIHEAAGVFDSIQDKCALEIIKMNSLSGDTSRGFERRMFRVLDGLHWYRPVHEQLSYSDGNDELPPETYRINLRFDHDGYDPSVISIYDKARRNVKLLEGHLKQHPTDITSHFFAGRDLRLIAETERAIDHLLTAIDLTQTNSNFKLTEELYTYLGLSYESSGRFHDAESHFGKMKELFPDYPDGFFQHARMLMRRVQREMHEMQNDIMRARENAVKYNGLSQSDTGIATWKSDLAMADAAGFMGNIRSRWQLLSNALTSNPNIANGREVLTALENEVIALAEKIEQTRRSKVN